MVITYRRVYINKIKHTGNVMAFHPNVLIIPFYIGAVVLSKNDFYCVHATTINSTKLNTGSVLSMTIRTGDKK